MDPYLPDLHEPQPQKRSGMWVGLLLMLIGLLVVFGGRTQQFRDSVVDLASRFGTKPAPQPHAPATLSASDLDARLTNMTTQAQVELLLSEAVKGSSAALDQISSRADSWRGTISNTPQLSPLLQSAWDSDDLRVRAASLDVYMAVYDVAKTSVSVSELEQRVAAEPGARPWGLWMLGALGNRGIEPIGVLREDLQYINDPNEETRAWVVQSLATLATNDAIDPLLDVLRNDRSPRVRESAARGLGEGGMFTRDQRQVAIPRLIDLAEDSAIDQQTRGWVLHSLRDITGTDQGADPKSWRTWWAQHHS
jgi:HEAT repeat protein